MVEEELTFPDNRNVGELLKVCIDYNVVPPEIVIKDSDGPLCSFTLEEARGIIQWANNQINNEIIEFLSGLESDISDLEDKSLVI